MKKVTNDAEYIEWFKASVLKLKCFLMEQPSVVFSGAYFILNFSGLVYLVVLSAEFEINIAKYLELSDFLMAFLANPSILQAMIAAFLSGSLFMYVAQRFFPGALKGTKQYKGWRSYILSNRAFYSINPLLLGSLLVFVCAPLMYSIQIGKLDAQLILEEKTDAYHIDLVNSVDIKGVNTMRFEALQMIAETERFVFFYMPQQQKSLVIARDNIAAMHMRSQDADNHF